MVRLVVLAKRTGKWQQSIKWIVSSPINVTGNHILLLLKIRLKVHEIFKGMIQK